MTKKKSGKKTEKDAASKPRKKTTRCAVSVKGITYQRVKNFCTSTGQSMSGYLERIIHENLDALGVPVPESIDPPKPRVDDTKRAKEIEEIISQHFTF